MTCEKVPFGNGGFAIMCSRGSRPRTWLCECKKRTPLAEMVCQQCGLYREGCPQCDADILPANPHETFVKGQQREHRCSAGCGVVIFA